LTPLPSLARPLFRPKGCSPGNLQGWLFSVKAGLQPPDTLRPGVRVDALSASPTYETKSHATVRPGTRCGSVTARSDCTRKHPARLGLGNDWTRQTPGHAHRGRARHGPFSAGHPTPSWLSRWFWRLSWTCLGCLVGVGTLTGTRASRNRAGWSRPCRAPSSVCCSLELHDIGLLLGACCLGWLGERTQVHSHHSAPACGGCWFWPFLVCWFTTQAVPFLLLAAANRWWVALHRACVRPRTSSSQTCADACCLQRQSLTQFHPPETLNRRLRVGLFSVTAGLQPPDKCQPG
jgi:hypothetical protein